MRGRAETAAWVVGALGIAGACLGWVLAPRDFAYAWLAGMVAFSGWPLGSLALVIAHTLTGGRWGEAIRPALLAGVAAVPIVVVLAVPLLVMLPTLYPWARAGAVLDNGWYLNAGFFAVRGVLYAVTWITLAGVALAGGTRLRRAAPAGAVLLAVTFSFAAIDLTMSMEPKFTSNIYGMIASTGAALLALAAAIASSAAAADTRTRDDLGKLLLALTILWTYLDFMQLLIVWQADLVTQAPWYLKRAFGTWGWVMAAVAAGHSAAPILLLIWPQVRRSARSLSLVAAWLVAWEVVRAWWTVLPEVPRLPGLVDLACLAGVGGIAVALALRGRRRAGAVPAEMRRTVSHA